MQQILEFNAKIEVSGVNPYVTVTSDQAAALKDNWRKPMPVLVQINGEPSDPWKINMMPRGNGDFYLYLHNDVRVASRTKVNDSVSVKIWFDVSYRTGPIDEMPVLLASAIAKDNIIKANWDALSPSKQKEVLRYLGRIKSAAVLEDNISKLISLLRGEDGHYLGRDWSGGK